MRGVRGAAAPRLTVPCRQNIWIRRIVAGGVGGSSPPPMVRSIGFSKIDFPKSFFFQHRSSIVHHPKFIIQKSSSKNHHPKIIIQNSASQKSSSKIHHPKFIIQNYHPKSSSKIIIQNPSSKNHHPEIITQNSSSIIHDYGSYGHG